MPIYQYPSPIFLHGGRVHAVDLAEMPGGPEALAAAALLRT